MSHLLHSPSPSADSPDDVSRLVSVGGAAGYSAATNLSPLFPESQNTFNAPPAKSCGKVICLGCIIAGEEAGSKDNCPFCRSCLPKSNKERLRRLQNRIEKNDPEAMVQLGVFYHKGLNGLKKDNTKAFEYNSGLRSWDCAQLTSTPGAPTCMEMHRRLIIRRRVITLESPQWLGTEWRGKILATWN